MVPYLESVCNPPIQQFHTRNWWFQLFPIQKLDYNPSFQRFHIQKPFATIFRNVQEGNPPFQKFHIRNRWFQWFPIQKLDCSPSFQGFYIQKLFATIFRNVYKGNPPFQRFYIQKSVVPMVPCLETGLQPHFPLVPYLETVCNHIQKCLGRQPSVSTVPYLENSGSNGSQFINWTATPLLNCPIFRNWWFQ